MKKKYKIILIVGAVLLLIGIVGSAGENEQVSEKEQINVEENETEASEKTIPGFHSVDLTLNLEDRGFECDDMDIREDGSLYWYCEQSNPEYLLYTEMNGLSSDKIQTVEAWVLDYTGTGDVIDEEGKDFLGFVATMPYDDAKPAETRDWVKENVRNNTEKVFSNVRFHLLWNENNAALSIENAEANWF